MIAGGFVADAFGARWAWGIASVVIGSAALIGYALARRAKEQPADVEAPPVAVPAAASVSAHHD
jgi:hypothetical protein